jgi:hypothetical protein
MDISAIFDKQTMDAIMADAEASGISAEDVSKVLGSLTDQNLAPTRSVNSAPELMSLLDDDQDAVVCDIADATGVDRMKTSTILMLAAPFLLKYLFSSGSSQTSSNAGLTTSLLSALLGGGMQQQSSSLLGSLLGAGVQQQPQQTDLLSALLGGGMQQQNNSLFGSLLGGGMQQQNTAYSNNSTAALMNSLLGGGMQPTQAQQQVQQNDLLSLFGGAQQQTQPVQQSSQGGGLLNALFNLLGDNG